MSYDTSMLLFADHLTDNPATNTFWPIPGTTDWQYGSLLSEFLAAFPTGSRRYYEKCIGHVHFFFLDSHDSEPDGNVAGSKQAEWLEAKLKLSPAHWKVVVMFHAPYSSVTPVAGMRWAFASWGADLVISGSVKNYERLSVGDLTYINNGLGGNGPIEPVVTPDANSQAHYDDGYGAGRITASETELKYEFLGIDGLVKDSVTLT